MRSRELRAQLGDRNLDTNAAIPFMETLFPELIVPNEVRVEGASIVWREEEQDVSMKENRVGCLWPFERLSRKQSSDDVLAFVREWGPLGIFPEIIQQRDNVLEFREPIDVYLDYAVQFRAILKIAIATINNEKADFEEWKVICGEDRKLYDRVGLGWQRFVLPLTLDTLIRESGAEMGIQFISKLGDPEESGRFALKVYVRDPIAWETAHLASKLEDTHPVSAPRLSDLTPMVIQPPRLRPSRLLATLALQTALVISSPTNLYQCAQCHKPFYSERKLRHDKRQLCADPFCKSQAHRVIERESYHNCKSKRKAQQDSRDEA